jgi:hypothetical protein
MNTFYREMDSLQNLDYKIAQVLIDYQKTLIMLWNLKHKYHICVKPLIHVDYQIYTKAHLKYTTCKIDKL